MELSDAVHVLSGASNLDIDNNLSSVEVSILKKAIQRLTRWVRKSEKLLHEDGLVEALLVKSKDLYEFFAQDHENAVGQPLPETEDPRIIDVVMAGKHPRDVDSLKLRQIMAERSLADDFNIWCPEKLNTMIEKKSLDLPKGRAGSIRAFIEKYFSNSRLKNTARTAIQKGLRHIALEKVNSTLGPGIIAFAVVADDCLGKMTFEEFQTIFESQRLSEVVNLTKTKSSWMCDALACYDRQNPCPLIITPLKPPQKQRKLLDARSKLETQQRHRTKVAYPPPGRVLGEIGVDIEHQLQGLQYGAQQSFEEIGTRQATQSLGVAHSTDGGGSRPESRLNSGIILAGNEDRDIDAMTPPSSFMHWDIETWERDLFHSRTPPSGDVGTGSEP